MKHASPIAAPTRAAAILALACAAALAACSTNPQSEKVHKALKQTTPKRQTVASIALSRVGAAYAEHMAGPSRFDDSGLAYYAYRQDGRPLPRSRQDQLQAGRPIALKKAEPGDLVFFRTDSADGRGRLTVGVLIDTHLAVAALPGSQDENGGVHRISLASDYWSQRLVGVSRILPQAASG